MNYLPAFIIIAWFAAIFGLSYLINRLLARSVLWRYYRWFVAPGVMVHELSHAVGCLLTGAEITEINFWKSSGGHVRHRQRSEPFFRWVADPIIALAPIWGTFLLLAFLTWLLIPGFFQSIQSGAYTDLLLNLPIARWQFWLYLYLVTSLAATIAPSKTDMNYAFGSLVVLFIVLFGGSYFTGFSEAITNLLNYLLPFGLFTIGIMVVALIIAAILAFPNRDKRFVAREQIE